MGFPTYISGIIIPGVPRDGIGFPTYISGIIIPGVPRDGIGFPTYISGIIIPGVPRDGDRSIEGGVSVLTRNQHKWGLHLGPPYHPILPLLQGGASSQDMGSTQRELQERYRYPVLHVLLTALDRQTPTAQNP